MSIRFGKSTGKQEAGKGDKAAKVEDAVANGAYALGKRVHDLGQAFGEFGREFGKALHEDEEDADGKSGK